MRILISWCLVIFLFWGCTLTDAQAEGYDPSGLLAQSNAFETFTEQKTRFVRDKKYPVYSAPDSTSIRSGHGKAVVSTNGNILVYGHENDWLLIQYEIDPEHSRFGYIKKAALAAGQAVKELSFHPIQGWMTEELSVTDDPLHSKASIATLYPNQPIRWLGTLGEWAYIMYEGAPCFRGFVPMAAIRTLPEDIRKEILSRFQGATVMDYLVVTDGASMAHAFVLIQNASERRLFCFQSQAADWTFMFETRDAIPQSRWTANLTNCSAGDTFEYGAGAFRSTFVSDGMNIGVITSNGESIEEYVFYRWREGRYQLVSYTYATQRVVDIIDQYMVFSGEGYQGAVECTLDTDIRSVNYASLPKTIEQAQNIK